MRFTRRQARPNPRRVVTPAESLVSPAPRGLILPGSITTDHADTKGISSRRVRFDRQGFAYDPNSYTLISVAGSDAWNRVGGASGHMYLQLGSFAYDAIIYAWGGFGWANNSGLGSFTGHAVIVLYDYDGTNWNVVERAVNPFPPSRLNNDGGFVNLSGFAQFILPAETGQDFWLGMQCHNVGAAAHDQQSHRDQQLMAFAVALDPEQPTNLAADSTLE